jgi:hypothetical protein
MKGLCWALLLLGLTAALGTSAMAVDVKFGGEFYAAGMYQDKTTFKKGTATDGPSTAFYYQRLRLNTEFIVSPGLTLTTRADIMERSWGAARSAPGTALDIQSVGTRAENENIAFDLLYVTYVSPIGLFRAGYQLDCIWGTVFGNTEVPAGRFGYMIRVKGVRIALCLDKVNNGERSYNAINAAVRAADRDSNYYTVFAIYPLKTGEVGLLGRYMREAGNRNLGIPGSDAGFLSKGIILTPYTKLQLGPVALQAELYYLFGQLRKWEGSAPLGNQNDTRLDQLTAWIDATADFGKVYVGGSVAYVSGDDPGTGAVEGSNLTGVGLNGGNDWNPCLVMFNSDRTYWAGNIGGYDASANGGPMTNAWFFQVRGGIRPIDKLDIMASVSYANADKKPSAAWLHNDYGFEVDLTAAYKITNNLSYMLGAGYLFTGHYYKGTSDTNAINNNFLVLNKLTLTF